MSQPPTNPHDFGDRLLRQPGVIRIRHADPTGPGYVVVERTARGYIAYRTTQPNDPPFWLPGSAWC